MVMNLTYYTMKSLQVQHRTTEMFMHNRVEAMLQHMMQTSSWALVVEEQSITSEHPIRLSEDAAEKYNNTKV